MKLFPFALRKTIPPHLRFPVRVPNTQISFQLHPVKTNPDSEARQGLYLPGLEGRQSGAVWNTAERVWGVAVPN